MLLESTRQDTKMETPNTTIQKRRLIRKMTRLIVPRLEQGFGTERVKEAFDSGGLTLDVYNCIKETALPLPRKTYEKYIPNTIPFDMVRQILNIPHKSLFKGIEMGLKDCGYE